MGEILKQEQNSDGRDGRRDSAEEEPRSLRVSLKYVDFVSPRGAFRARQESAELELAPKDSEVWVDWRDDLKRRIAGTAMRADALLAEKM